MFSLEEQQKLMSAMSRILDGHIRGALMEKFFSKLETAELYRIAVMHNPELLNNGTFVLFSFTISFYFIFLSSFEVS